MKNISPERQANFRTAIERFLEVRLDGKLEKLAVDDPKRNELIAQFQFETWIGDAARRVGQIQVVTHSLKPIHPDARGTNLYRPPDAIHAHDEIGSHQLSGNFAGDVVGNAAALDVYKFLKVQVEERSLLDWMSSGDPELAAALSEDPQKAEVLISAFAGITRPRSDIGASHAQAKQLYWLAGDDPCNNDHYQLLAPLYASSLAHVVFQTINEDRFGDAPKEARQARREQRSHDTGYREYPSLAVQKLGGTKPQNISQLNSERGGNNYLLASLPPKWKTRELREPSNIESIFPRFGSQQDVRKLVGCLNGFLLADPPANADTRNRVDGYLDSLIDELVAFAGKLQSGLRAGWSNGPQCQLVEAERLWLDPRRAEGTAEQAVEKRTKEDADFLATWRWMDWPDEIGKRFGNWLNSQLDKKLSLGEAEHRQWRRELLVDEDELGWAWQLHEQRKRADAPTYIPTRRAVP